MNVPIYAFLLIVVGVLGFSALAFFLGYILRRRIAESKIGTAEQRVKSILEEAQREAANQKRAALLEAKDELYRSKEAMERENRDKRGELRQMEQRQLSKEASLERRSDNVDRKEAELESRQAKLQNREQQAAESENRVKQVLEEQNRQLERIGGLTKDEAKEILKENMRQDAEREAAVMVKDIVEQAKEDAEREARNILALAVERCASDHAVESTVSVVHLPSDEMKGRIIGREGRNIRSIENATGVDLIIDDTPEAVIVSAFDPIRREIARESLERLIQDGRIHPARIEEVVEKVKQEMEDKIREEAEQAIFELGISGIHRELIKTLGRLAYRTSYGQNVLQHSKEVAYLAGVLASELGADFNLARRMGLLHDLGKAVDHEVEGTHAQIGADLAQRFGESPKVVNAIASHHEQCEPQTLEAVLIAACDTISATRPGARRETLESYIKRVKQLEELAGSFAGVSKSYAIQAGREVRIIVEHDQVPDEEAFNLARQIARKIEEEQDYPGKIKVTVIREVRAVEYAK